MLKVLAYIEDRGTFEFIAASESGRLATRTQNPFAHLAEVQDLERVLKAKLEETDPKPEGLDGLIQEVHQYNETVSSYERVRYIKSLTPQLMQAIQHLKSITDMRAIVRAQESERTTLEGDIKVVKVERDGK